MPTQTTPDAAAELATIVDEIPGVGDVGIVQDDRRLRYATGSPSAIWALKVSLLKGDYWVPENAHAESEHAWIHFRRDGRTTGK